MPNNIEFILIYLALAFAGGMFGATVGALLSFVLCGAFALISSCFYLAGDAATGLLVDNWLTWGPLVGPHTAFVGGCWAAVYARYHANYHNSKDICQPLITLQRNDVILVGGLGGTAGALISILVQQLPVYCLADGTTLPSGNHVASGVVIASIAGRIIFGKTGIFGQPPEKINRFEGSERNNWLPQQHSIGAIALLTVTVGLPAAFTTYLHSGTHLIIFAIMTLLFLFMVLGQGVVAAHHIAICAYAAVAVTGNVAWGLCFALLAAFSGDFFAYLFTAHGDSHIDPPSCAIMLCGFIQPLLIRSGIMPYSPLQGLNNSKALYSLQNMFLTNGSFTGLIALIIVAVSMPLLTYFLRSYPASGPALAEPEINSELPEKTT